MGKKSNQEGLEILSLSCPTCLCCLSGLCPQAYIHHQWTSVEHGQWPVMMDANWKQTIQAHTIWASAPCVEPLSPLPWWASLALWTSFPAVPSPLPGISGHGGGVLSSTCLGVSTFRVSWGTGKTKSFSVSPFQQRSREATSTLLSSLRTCVCMELVLRMPIVCCTALSLHSLPHTNLPEESKGIKPTLPKRTSQVQEVWCKVRRRAQIS